MTNDPFTRWNLTPIINVSGTMTSIGASRVPSEVRESVDFILSSFVNINEFQSKAGMVISRLTGAEAGCVTASSAAALTQTVAACFTGDNLAKIESLPDIVGERRVLLPMGHMVNYGAPVGQALKLAGADVVLIGTAAACEIWHLEAALEQGAAAAVYVISHHTVRENEIPLDLFINCCRHYGVPTIVDVASEYDLTGPIALGADIAIYSGHKMFCGVTSGIVAGKSNLIKATYLQHLGIGRVMKAGKESIAGAIAALERWEKLDHVAIQKSEESIAEFWLKSFSDLPGILVSTCPDWTGNPIIRICIKVDPKNAGFHAWELSAQLASRNPSIVVREDLIERQEIYLDPCNVTLQEAEAVVSAIQEEACRFRDLGSGCKQSWSEVKQGRQQAIQSWSGSGNATR